MGQQERNLYGAMSKQVVSWKGNFWATIHKDIQTKNKVNPNNFSLLVQYCSSIIG
jgi:hypothetical protein